MVPGSDDPAPTGPAPTGRARARIEVLGAVRLHPPGATAAVMLTGRIDRCVLALLVVHRGRCVDAAHLVDRLWGDDPPRHATSQLRRAVRDLARAIDPAGARIVGDGSWFGLELPAGRTDLDEFRRSVATGRRLAARGRTDRAAVVLGRAVGLWSDASPFLGSETDGWPETVELREERLNAVEDHAGALVAAGAAGEAATRLALVARDHPSRESLAVLRIRALARQGREAEALDVYAETERRLAETLGLDPGPELAQEAARVRGARPPSPVGGLEAAAAG